MQSNSLEKLKTAGILSSFLYPNDLRPYLKKPVSVEQAALFFDWLTQNREPDTLRVRREVALGRLGSTRGTSLRFELTVQDLLDYDGLRRHPQWRLLGLVVWIQAHRWQSVVMAIISFLGFLIGTYSQINPDALSFFIHPPDSSLTVILDTSSAMSETYFGSLTRFQAASQYIQEQTDPQKSVNEKRKIAIWSQRGITNATGNGCKKDFDQLTKRYMLPDRVNVNSLLSSVTLNGKPWPGEALWKAVKRMPRYSLNGWKHLAIVLSSTSDTCAGKEPVREICDSLEDIADSWSFGPHAEFQHKVIVVDLDASRAASNTQYCQDRNVTVWKVDFDPRDSAANARTMCEIDPSLCDLSIDPIPTDLATPTPVTPPSAPTPSRTLTPTLTPSPTNAPPTPSATPSATSTNTPSATPSATWTMTPTPSPTVAAGAIVPTPTPALKLRAPSGRFVSVQEGCLSGLEIGQIGLLPQYSQQVEAEVPVVPDDLLLLSINGCIRVFTGIVGRPDYGFPGYVQAEEVCVVRSSYDYWQNQAVFYLTDGISRLRPCDD